MTRFWVRALPALMFFSAANTMMVAQSSDQPWYWYCTTRDTPWKQGTHGSSETFTVAADFYSTVFRGDRMSNSTRERYEEDWFGFIKSSQPDLIISLNSAICELASDPNNRMQRAVTSEAAEASRKAEMASRSARDNSGGYTNQRVDVETLPFQPQSPGGSASGVGLSGGASSGDRASGGDYHPQAPAVAAVRRPDAEMKFLEEQIGTQGPIQSNLMIITTMGHRVSQQLQIFNVTQFSAEPNSCQISYSLANPRTGIDSQFSFNLRNVTAVTSMTFEDQWAAGAGQGGAVSTAIVSPPEWAVHVVLSDSDYLFYFLNQDSADHVSQSFLQAARQCGAQI